LATHSRIAFTADGVTAGAGKETGNCFLRHRCLKFRRGHRQSSRTKKIVSLCYFCGGGDHDVGSVHRSTTETPHSLSTNFWGWGR
jgi:hypothetical protein